MIPGAFSNGRCRVGSSFGRRRSWLRDRGPRRRVRREVFLISRGQRVHMHGLAFDGVFLPGSVGELGIREVTMISDSILRDRQTAELMGKEDHSRVR